MRRVTRGLAPLPPPLLGQTFLRGIPPTKGPLGPWGRVGRPRVRRWRVPLPCRLGASPASPRNLGPCAWALFDPRSPVVLVWTANVSPARGGLAWGWGGRWCGCRGAGHVGPRGPLASASLGLLPLLYLKWRVLLGVEPALTLGIGRSASNVVCTPWRHLDLLDRPTVRPPRLAEAAILNSLGSPWWCELPLARIASAIIGHTPSRLCWRQSALRQPCFGSPANSFHGSAGVSRHYGNSALAVLPTPLPLPRPSLHADVSRHNGSPALAALPTPLTALLAPVGTTAILLWQSCQLPSPAVRPR